MRLLGRRAAGPALAVLCLAASAPICVLARPIIDAPGELVGATGARAISKTTTEQQEPGRRVGDGKSAMSEEVVYTRARVARAKLAKAPLDEDEHDEEENEDEDEDDRRREHGHRTARKSLQVGAPSGTKSTMAPTPSKSTGQKQPSHAPTYKTHAQSATTTGRTLPPANLPDTLAGFSLLASVDYALPDARGDMAWTGSRGIATRIELETALAVLLQVPPQLENGVGNGLSVGTVGQAAYNAALLYEISGDRRALDIAVKAADNMLSLQNHPQTGLVMWTGRRDPVWPTKPFPGQPKAPALPYAGCEQGHIVGHMVNTALLILKSPILWGLVPAPYDGPTSFQSNDTYLTRAIAFVHAGDRVYDEFFIPQFFDANRTLIQPNDPRWLQTADGNPPGGPMAWNRRFMVLHGMLKLAAAHETLLFFDPGRTYNYDQYVRANTLDFIANLQETTASDGTPTYLWTYVKGRRNVEEVKGIHAYYDVWGLFMAWQRNAPLFGITDTISRRFANTMQHTIAQPDKKFAGLVNGQSTEKAYTVPNLWGGWTFYSQWYPQWFDTVVNANLATSFQRRSWLSIPLLWTRHAHAVNNLAFWRSPFSSGHGTIPGTGYAPGGPGVLLPASGPWPNGRGDPADATNATSEHERHLFTLQTRSMEDGKKIAWKVR